MEFEPFKPNKPSSRYIKPKKSIEVPTKALKYKNALELAKDINFNDFNRYYCIIDGTFIFGDFIEAFIVNYNIKVKKMTISTLSLSLENIESLRNLIYGNYVEELNLIVSDYWFQNERNNLVRHIYDRLDYEDRFQLASASVHTKICIFETSNNRKFVFHGSANLRSSSNVEQLMLEECEILYNFNDEIHDSIIRTYKTINKSVRRKTLWQTITRGATVQEKNKTLENGEKHKQPIETLNTQQCNQQEHHFKSEKIKIERFKF